MATKKELEDKLEMTTKSLALQTKRVKEYQERIERLQNNINTISGWYVETLLIKKELLDIVNNKT